MHLLTKFLSRWKVWEQVQALTVFLPELKELLYAGYLYLSINRSGELRTQKLKSHLMRTQSLKVLH